MFNLAAKERPFVDRAASKSKPLYPIRGMSPKTPPTPEMKSPKPIDIAKTAKGGAKYRGLALAMCDLVRIARQAPVSKNCLASFRRLDLG